MRRILLIFLMVFAVTAVSQSATTLVWQGGDGDWSDLNWTRNGVADSNGTDDDMVGYINYQGFDITLGASTGNISKTDASGTGGLTKMSAGIWTQAAGTLSIVETGNYAVAMKVGLIGDSNTAVMTLSSTAALDLTNKGKNNKYALTMEADGSIVMSDSASITLANSGAFSNGLEMLSGTSFTMKDNSTLTAPSIKFGSAGSLTTLFTFESGTITLSNSNAIRTASQPDPNDSQVSNRINFTTTEGAGAAQLVHTDNTDTVKNLAAKLIQGMFSIDGVLVQDTTTVVNGYKFQLDANDTTDTLSLVVPEPATIALLGLGGLLFRRKRR